MVELTRRFGVRPRLPWYDTHVTVDNLKGETRVNGKALCVRRGLALLCDRAEMDFTSQPRLQKIKGTSIAFGGLRGLVRRAGRQAAFLPKARRCPESAWLRKVEELRLEPLPQLAARCVIM